MTTLFPKCIVISFLCLLLFNQVVGQLSHKNGNCPLRNSVTKCIPSCTTDYQCPLNQKCCPNKCGNQSCASSSAINTGSDGGYKGSYGDKDVYCAGVKCRNGEKCELDRQSKREKCIRG